MGRSRKDLYYGSRTSKGGSVARMAVPDRTSKAARPWNDPRVVEASQAYGVKLTSYKKVHEYENAIEDKGSITADDRFTCRDCGKFKTDHEEGETHGNQA